MSPDLGIEAQRSQSQRLGVLVRLLPIATFERIANGRLVPIVRGENGQEVGRALVLRIGDFRRFAECDEIEVFQLVARSEGADFRAPLGRAVIGGTITSTLLTLLVIPTVYEILDDFRSWAASKFRRRARAGAREPVPTPASPSAD